MTSDSQRAGMSRRRFVQGLAGGGVGARPVAPGKDGKAQAE